jgi:Tfp pilus assembly protein PilV
MVGTVRSGEQRRHRSARVIAQAAAGAGARVGEAGFSLIDTLIATALLVVGTLSAASVGMYCSNLQQRVRDYSTAHMVASDMIERLRVGTPATVYTQYTANPNLQIQGRQVNVAFPQAVLQQTYHGMTNSAALSAGFLPVQITVTSGQERFTFDTFVGQR